jgi:hypothetical protein
MDWLWPLYGAHMGAAHGERLPPDGLADAFLCSLAESTAMTVMEPIGDTIRFRVRAAGDSPRCPI